MKTHNEQVFPKQKHRLNEATNNSKKTFHRQTLFPLITYLSILNKKNVNFKITSHITGSLTMLHYLKSNRLIKSSKFKELPDFAI